MEEKIAKKQVAKEEASKAPNDALGIVGEDLDFLIPQENKIIFGKTKNSVKEYFMYPFALRDLSKVSKMIGNIGSQLFKNEGKFKLSEAIDSLISNNLGDLTEIVAMATFQPDESPSKEQLSKRGDEILNAATLKQTVRAINLLFEINDVSFILKNVTKMMGAITRK